MQIIAENLGKRFNFNWIFRNINLSVQSGQCIAITGPNGSGKSTFLQVIAGAAPHSEGNIQYIHKDKTVHADDFYDHLALATPYLELIEEFTLLEHLEFHFKFKKLKLNSISEVVDRIGLAKASNREIRFYSSGMKQRVKLALAFFSDTPLLILDEPTSNLDKQGITWYRDEVVRHLDNRIVLIGSNVEAEYEFSEKQIRMG